MDAERAPKKETKPVGMNHWGSLAAVLTVLLARQRRSKPIRIGNLSSSLQGSRLRAVVAVALWLLAA